jgi:predicted Zn-dependent protease with MMP-like domain
MKRMSLKRFGRVVAEVMETLPPEFYGYLEEKPVVVDVEEEPDERTLREAGYSDEDIDAGASLLGIYETTGGLHRIRIFKRPLEEEFPERERFLTEVRKTVVHELAHHFGFDERDLERFDDNPDPFPEKEVRP